MTVLIELPGVLSSTAGLEKLIFTKNGFPADGLQDLFLFTDASGTALANAIEGRPGGALEKLVEGDFGGGYAWLTGGGVRLQGTQIASFPALTRLCRSLWSWGERSPATFPGLSRQSSDCWHSATVPPRLFGAR